MSANITGSFLGGIMLNYTDPNTFLYVSLGVAFVGAVMSVFIISPPKLTSELSVSLISSLSRPIVIGFQRNMLLMIPIAITRVCAFAFYIAAIPMLSPSLSVSRL
jgi:hypothetical protein